MSENNTDQDQQVALGFRLGDDSSLEDIPPPTQLPPHYDEIQEWQAHWIQGHVENQHPNSLGTLQGSIPEFLTPTQIQANMSATVDAMDGVIIGGNGHLYSVNQNLDIFNNNPNSPDVSYIRPQDNTFDESKNVVVYINGILGLPGDAQDSAARVAEATNSRVLSLYNAPLQSEGNQFIHAVDAGTDDRFVQSQATASTTQILVNAYQSGNMSNLTLAAHSNGSAIIRAAVRDFTDYLENDRGLSPAQVDEQLGKLTVLTAGAASMEFPDGPKYVHLMNVRDRAAGEVPGIAGTVDNLDNRLLGNRIDVVGELFNLNRDWGQDARVIFIEHDHGWHGNEGGNHEFTQYDDYIKVYANDAEATYDALEPGMYQTQGEGRVRPVAGPDEVSINLQNPDEQPQTIGADEAVALETIGLSVRS